MRRFTIAVEASGGQALEATPRIRSVLQVSDAGDLELVELTVAAADGGPIPSSIARNIDFDLLAAGLRTIVSATVAPAEGEPVRDEAVVETVIAAGREVDDDGPSERPYRRMPDVDQVLAVMERTQSVGKVAHHFDVPRYTAQAWINRLRRTGQLDDRTEVSARG